MMHARLNRPNNFTTANHVNESKQESRPSQRQMSVQLTVCCKYFCNACVPFVCINYFEFFIIKFAMN